MKCFKQSKTLFRKTLFIYYYFFFSFATDVVENITEHIPLQYFTECRDASKGTGTEQ